jgi:hypothetical protein
MSAPDPALNQINTVHNLLEQVILEAKVGKSLRKAL